MRRVKFDKYDRSTRTWVREQFGTFHQWGQTYEEFEQGPGNSTMGIIEDDTGHVHLIYPEDITFLKVKSTL